MKTFLLGVMLGWLATGATVAQADEPELRGQYFGRTSLTSGDGSFAATGTIQQTINDFRSGTRGVIRSSLVVAADVGLSLASWDVLKVRGRRVSMQTTFLSPCGCGGPGLAELTGTFKMRRHSLRYSVVSADGTYFVSGSMQLKHNGMVRTEIRSIYDPGSGETDTFTFSSRLYPQNRSSR